MVNTSILVMRKYIKRDSFTRIFSFLNGLNYCNLLEILTVFSTYLSESKQEEEKKQKQNAGLLDQLVLLACYQVQNLEFEIMPYPPPNRSHLKYLSP